MDSGENRTLDTRIVVYDSLLIASIAFLTFVLLTAYFKRRTILRTSSWFSLIISWLIYAVSYLFIAGYHTGPEPPFGLCVFQAASVYTAPVVVSAANAAYTLHVFLSLNTVLFRRAERRTTLALLAIFPYALSIARFVLALLLIRNPSTVNRSPTYMYCRIDDPIQPTITGYTALPILVGSLCLEGYIGFMLWKNWTAFKRLNHASHDPHISLSTIIRLCLFTFVPLFGIGITAFTARDFTKDDMVWPILLPSLPLLASLIFGTQKDILTAWVTKKKVDA